MSQVPTNNEIRATHRRQQIGILVDAMSNHGPVFTEEDMQRIGYAVFAAVGRVMVMERLR